MQKVQKVQKVQKLHLNNLKILQRRNQDGGRKGKVNKAFSALSLVCKISSSIFPYMEKKIVPLQWFFKISYQKVIKR